MRKDQILSHRWNCSSPDEHNLQLDRLDVAVFYFGDGLDGLSPAVIIEFGHEQIQLKNGFHHSIQVLHAFIFPNPDLFTTYRRSRSRTFDFHYYLGLHLAVGSV